jgi:hypothetical protein
MHARQTAKMNADVLSVVAGYCDIDSRRALSLPPHKLRRDAAFDAQMQTIHQERKSTYMVEHWGTKRLTSTWHIQLNCKTKAVVVIMVFGDLGTSDAEITWYIPMTGTTWPSSFAASAVCTFGFDGEIFTYHTLDPPLPSASRYMVFANFISGRWTVNAKGRVAQDKAALARLGFVLKT